MAYIPRPVVAVAPAWFVLFYTTRTTVVSASLPQASISAITTLANWHAHQALCYVELARAKSLPLQGGIQSRLNVLFTLVDTFMFYVHEVEVEQKRPQVKLVEQLDRVISDYADHDMAYHGTTARDPPTGLYFDEFNTNSFLALTDQSRFDSPKPL